MFSIIDDLRLSVRYLRNSPGFALAAVASLTLGTAASLTMFAVMEGVFLQALPYANSDRLVAVWETNPEKNRLVAPTSTPNFLEWIKEAKSLKFGASSSMFQHVLVTETSAEMVGTVSVTEGYFDLLGVTPSAGRQLSPDDHVEGAAVSAMISDKLASRLFPGSSSSAVGAQLRLNDRRVLVAGVLPAEYVHPQWSGIPFSPDVWIAAPLVLYDGDRHYQWLNVVARLSAGVTVETAASELRLIGERLARAYPEENAGSAISVARLRDAIGREFRRPIWALSAAVAVLVGVTAANLVILILLRSKHRRAHVAIRRALGAERFVLVREVVIEGCLLGLSATVLGSLLATTCVQWLNALRPEIVISAEPLSLSTTALGMAIGLPAAFCVAVSLAALRYTLASEANTGLRLPGDRASAGSGSWGGPLVAAEVAMTLILVVGATVLIRTVSVLDRSPTGFDPERLLLADVQLPIRNASDDPRTEVFLRNLIKRISNLDGVAAVGAVSTFPLSSASGRSHDEFRIEGSSDPLPATMTIKIATPDYFRTAGIPLLAGRGFDEADSYERPRVALVNQRFVSRHFRNSDSLGRVLQSENGRFTIVGVIADVAPQSRTAPIESEIYIPHRQRALSNMTLVVKAKRDASALIPQVQSELRELDKTKPISNVRTGSEQLARSIAKFNLSMNLLVVSGVIALITALIGVTSVIAYSVHRRTREFAIRAALGATAGDVRRAAVRSTMMMTVVGLLLGTLIAFYASRWASSVAAGITQAEPLSFIGVGLFFTGASWIATLLVTRKALSSTLQSVLQRD